MQPGVKGLRSLLPDTASTRILSILDLSKNWTFFSFWELFEGIAVETRKIQSNIDGEAIFRNLGGKIRAKIGNGLAQSKMLRFPREYRRQDGFIGHRLQKSCIVQPQLQIAYGA